MITYTTGDLLESKAEALVNTVNCEGYMGKGIAYQFKMKFPNNNKDYIKACKTGKLTVGKLHHFKENEKIIINFPTKDKWREKSKIEYITSGLDELLNLITTLNISSVAIPPLGSGNGGLLWSEVKLIIENKINILSNSVDFIIYEPSKNYKTKPTNEPILNPSALVLMDIKLHLTKFNTIRLQKSAYFLNIFSGQNYFKFKKYKFGPYDNSIAIISKNIKAYQDYYEVKNTKEAYTILKNKLVSKKVEDKLSFFEDAINKATSFVNEITTDHELECLSTVTFIIQNNPGIDLDEIIIEFHKWSKEKREKFSEDEIRYSIEKLENYEIIESTLIGYDLKKYTE
ncbi:MULTISPECIES: macro domain-containing protein [unclassified Paenibacillus]|uniref:type II toxin-antitoxin system antitoxin DNA ADP-ribosyl glycohydrolase DarG n=1 Tax=unclassified Paenibacillus TaxID=185978 RepID=UPI000895CE88|nr:macro domain-containing protein [Paenibacillus sp. 276b]SEB10603.1 O-acetyl-ADP-ribose deacetylase (regulator of RNase III), contains Macro domain [Paenibacillus sp. 276b]